MPDPQSILVTKRDELAEKQKRLSEVFDEAGAEMDMSKVTCLDGTSAEKVVKIDEMNRELEDLQREVTKMNLEQTHQRVIAAGEAMKGVSTGAPPFPRGDERKSFGEAFVKSAAYQGFKKDHRIDVTSLIDIGLKTLFETGAGWAPESLREPGIVPAATRPIRVIDLIPVTGTSFNAVIINIETTRTHAAAEKAEGAAFAESTFVITPTTFAVRKITDSIPVTDEQLEDEQEVQGYLDTRLRFGLRQRLDLQLLVGDGTAPNLQGILNTAGIQTQAKGTDPEFDAIHKAITKCRVTGRANPDGVVLHPNDWETFRLKRTADGIYIMGNPSQAGPMTLFGLPVAVSDAETENTGLVGDFATFSGVRERRGVTVKIGYSGTQFAEGEQLIRADLRVAFAVTRAAAFCTVTGI